MSCSMPISNKFHFEQFSPGFVLVYTNYCVDSFEHLHLGKGPFTHWPLFGGATCFCIKGTYLYIHIYIHLYLAYYMPYNLGSTTARTDNSVLTALSSSTNYTPTTRNTHALIHPPNMTSYTKDLCLALADPAVILALGMTIENKNAELLSTFDGRIQDLEKVKARDKRMSSLEYELQSIKAQATRSIDGLCFFQQSVFIK